MPEIVYLVLCSTLFGCGVSATDAEIPTAKPYTRIECFEEGERVLRLKTGVFQVYECVDEDAVNERFPEVQTRTLKT